MDKEEAEGRVVQSEDCYHRVKGRTGLGGLQASQERGG